MAFEYFTGLGIPAGVLLVSAVLLWSIRRSAAATVPFAVFWSVIGAYAMWSAYDLRPPYRCVVQLCMPDFGVFIFSAPLAAVVSASVIGSAAINRVVGNGGDFFPAQY